MIITMIMVLPCSDWRKGMLAFSSLSPSETVCTVAWCGRLAQEEEWGERNGEKEKEFRKRKSPSKVTPSESLSMFEFRHAFLSCIMSGKIQFAFLCTMQCNYFSVIVRVDSQTNTETIKHWQVPHLCCCCGLFAVQQGLSSVKSLFCY